MKKVTYTLVKKSQFTKVFELDATDEEVLNEIDKHFGWWDGWGAEESIIINNIETIEE